MKNRLLRLSCFGATLALGLLVNFGWNWHPPTSFCEVAANPKKYANEIVRLRVLASNDSGNISAFVLCSGRGPDPIAAASVDLIPQDSELLKENRYVRIGPVGNTSIAEIILVGEFDPGDHGITHCWTPPFEIHKAHIERVIANHEFEDNQQALRWMESNSH